MSRCMSRCGAGGQARRQRVSRRGCECQRRRHKRCERDAGGHCHCRGGGGSRSIRRCGSRGGGRSACGGKCSGVCRDSCGGNRPGLGCKEQSDAAEAIAGNRRQHNRNEDQSSACQRILGLQHRHDDNIFRLSALISRLDFVRESRRRGLIEAARYNRWNDSVTSSDRGLPLVPRAG